MGSIIDSSDYAVRTASDMRVWLFWAGIVLSVLLVFYLWNVIDGCLDAGGRWNYDTWRCEGARQE